ncbi:hypothetical protein NKH82_23855 [Mesorhizobium sp. M0915]|uniref:hypothetical protein n=1 Tax=Mesorhizobium sp. M0915 TaxID=2957027 RepID=UPI00333A6902
MDIFGRLSDYDVFAYLPQGFFVLAAFDFFFGTSFVIHASWDVPTGVFVLFLSYAAGHLVAGPASRILEAGIVHDMLKPPSVHLLSPEQRASWLLRSLLPAYFSPLSRPTRACVQAALAKAGTGLHGEWRHWRPRSCGRAHRSSLIRPAWSLRRPSGRLSEALAGCKLSRRHGRSHPPAD